MQPAFVLLIFVTLGTVMQNVNMAYTDMVTFFDLKNNNLSSVTWVHAVNNKALLSEALKSNAMMLEADIVFGTLNGTTDLIPIMAHPPANTSDLSLKEFLEDILTHNNENDTLIRKGVKLDFKSIEALEKSTDLIQGLYNNMTYPVWINADIIKGPLNAGEPVDATGFFRIGKLFKNSTLSIGWTTTEDKTNYTDNQITAMLNAVKNNHVNQSVTFSVRASIAAESSKQMQTLLSNITESTLTIWSSENDPVNVTNLRKLIETVGLNKVFVDIPADIASQLNLQTIGAGSIIGPASKLLAVVIVSLLLL